MATLTSGSPWAKEEASPEAMLSIAHRDIFMLRTAIQGASPEIRAKRVTQRINAMNELELSQPITRSMLKVGDIKAVRFSIGDRKAFVLLDKDLEIGEQLHSHIHDEFNTYSVQIRSPHFILQPKSDAVVEKEDWLAEPTERPATEKS